MKLGCRVTRASPSCETCIRVVNARRRETGLPEWPVAADAYTWAEEGEV